MGFLCKIGIILIFNLTTCEQIFSKSMAESNSEVNNKQIMQIISIYNFYLINNLPSVKINNEQKNILLLPIISNKYKYLLETVLTIAC
jgi:hypothetical protein